LVTTGAPRGASYGPRVPVRRYPVPRIASRQPLALVPLPRLTRWRRALNSVSMKSREDQSQRLRAGSSELEPCLGVYARLFFCCLHVPAPRPIRAINPAPKRITDAGRGTAVMEVMTPKTREFAPSSKIIRN